MRAIALGRSSAQAIELRDHRVVEDRHLEAGGRAAVVADAGPRRRRAAAECGRATAGNCCRDPRRRCGTRSRGPCGVSSACRIEVEPLAARDADLPAHEIDAGHHLRDRMLDLQPRVHLEEVERGRPRRAGTRSCRRWCSRPRARRRRRPRSSPRGSPASPPATASPRPPSGGAAEWSIRARQTAAPCRAGRPAAALRCAAAAVSRRSR